MASRVGYLVIERVFPQKLAAEAAAAVQKGLKKVWTELRKTKYTEFEVPEIGLRVRDEFIKVRKCLTLDYSYLICYRKVIRNILASSLKATLPLTHSSP
jgi:hypothetical protein